MLNEQERIELLMKERELEELKNREEQEKEEQLTLERREEDKKRTRHMKELITIMNKRTKKIKQHGRILTRGKLITQRKAEKILRDLGKHEEVSKESKSIGDHVRKYGDLMKNKETSLTKKLSARFHDYQEKVDMRKRVIERLKVHEPKVKGELRKEPEKISLEPPREKKQRKEKKSVKKRESVRKLEARPKKEELKRKIKEKKLMTKREKRGKEKPKKEEKISSPIVEEMKTQGIVLYLRPSTALSNDASERIIGTLQGSENPHLETLFQIPQTGLTGETTSNDFEETDVFNKNVYMLVIKQYDRRGDMMKQKIEGSEVTLEEPKKSEAELKLEELRKIAAERSAKKEEELQKKWSEIRKKAREMRKQTTGGKSKQ